MSSWTRLRQPPTGSDKRLGLPGSEKKSSPYCRMGLRLKSGARRLPELRRTELAAGTGSSWGVIPVRPRAWRAAPGTVAHIVRWPRSSLGALEVFWGHTPTNQSFRRGGFSAFLLIPFLMNPRSVLFYRAFIRMVEWFYLEVCFFASFLCKRFFQI